MAIFKLLKKGDSIEGAELVEASRTTLDLERHLESWLEQSPWAIAQEPLLIISRQATATLEDRSVYPDLLALDGDGNLVVVELKKGRAPRDVIAQLLEYASWADDLNGEEVADIAERYLALTCPNEDQSLPAIFCDTFETDSLPPLNQKLRLFVAAEEIPIGIARVARFLRTSHGLDINCVQFTVYQTDAGEILVNSETIVGGEDAKTSRKVSSTSDRWTGKPVKEVVWDGVKAVTQGDLDRIFSPKEIVAQVLETHPQFNRSTVTCQLIADCVNHKSRHHYPGGQQDRYWWLGTGKYRLYSPETDRLETE